MSGTVKLVERGTGKLVDVPEKDAKAAFQSGNYGIPKGGSLPVAIGTDVGQVSAAEAQRAFQAGMRVAQEDEYRKAAAAQKYGGVGGAAAAFGTAAVRGAGSAIGLPTDAVITGVADQLGGTTQGEWDPYRGMQYTTAGQRVRADLQGLQQENSIASGVGEMAGLTAAMALTGGGPVGEAGALGEGLAARLGAAEGGLLRAGVRAGAEGAFLGGVGAVNEAALGNEDVTAEKLVTGLTHGAILGGATGTLLHAPMAAGSALREAGGRFLARLSPEAIEGVAAKQFGYVPKGLGASVRDGYEKLAASASGGDVETIRALNPLDLSPEARAARKLAVYDAPAVQDEAARAIRTHGDAMLRDSRLVSEEAMGGMKESHIRRSVMRGNEAETAAAALRHADDLIAANDAMLTHVDGAKNIKSLESASKAAYMAKSAIQDAIESGAPDANARIFMELDQLKRFTQRYASGAKNGVMAISDPLERMAAQREATMFAERAEAMRKGLEDTSLWGKAAEDQAAINKAWTKQIEASRRFESRLTTDVGRDPNDPYLRQRGIDPAKAESYVKSLTNPNQDLTHQAIRDYVESTRELTGIIRDRFELDPSKVEAVERVGKAAEEFGRTTERATDALTMHNQFKALMAAEGEGSGMGAALGGLLGGAPGAALGAVGGAIMRPGKTIAQLAAVERMMGKVDARLGTGISDFFAGRGPRVAETPSARMLPSGAGGREAFERSVANVAELAASPEKLSERIAKALGTDLAEVAPNVSGAFAATVTRGLQFLASKTPPGMTPPADVLTPQLMKPLYSDSEMRRWTRYAAAVNDPSTILESMARGSLSPEEVEVMREVYPQLYQQTQQRIVTKLSTLTALPPRAQRIQLSILFALPADASMTPDMLQTLQLAAQQPGPAQGAPLKPGNRTASTTAPMSQQIGEK